MCDKPAKSGLAYAAFVALVLTGSYALSFGPACWIAQRTGSHGAVVSFVYQPLLQVACRGPQPVAGCLMQYSRLGMSAGNCEAMRQDEASGYCHWDHMAIFACVW
jgi:hypothetical protein